jgi:hypothetical protein
MAFGAVSMMVGLVVDLLGFAIYLERMAFGSVLMMVLLVNGLVGVVSRSLRVVLRIRLS